MFDVFRLCIHSLPMHGFEIDRLVAAINCCAQIIPAQGGRPAHHVTAQSVTYMVLNVPCQNVVICSVYDSFKLHGCSTNV